MVAFGRGLGPYRENVPIFLAGDDSLGSSHPLFWFSFERGLDPSREDAPSFCNWTTRLDGCDVSFERGLVLTLLRKINYLATVHLSSMAQPSLARLALILLLNLCLCYLWVFFLYIFIFIFGSVSSVSSSLFAFASRLEFDDFILMRVCKIRSIWTSYCNVAYVFLIFQISNHSEWLLSWWGWDLFIKSHDAGTSGDP